MTRVAHQNQRHVCAMHRGHSSTPVTYDSVTEVLPLEDTVTPVLAQVTQALHPENMVTPPEDMVTPVLHTYDTVRLVLQPKDTLTPMLHTYDSITWVLHPCYTHMTVLPRCYTHVIHTLQHCSGVTPRGHAYTHVTHV